MVRAAGIRYSEGMQDVSVHPGSEVLSADEEMVIPQAGRVLPPPGPERDALADAVMAAAREISAGASDVSEAELDEMLAEAFAYVRSHPA